MKIYVTGGTGFIGSYVVKALSENKHEVIVLARNPKKAPGLKDLKGVRVVKAPMDDFAALKRVIKKPDALVHIALCWGDTGPDMILNETLSSVKLIELGIKAGAKKIIFTSSTAAQGSLSGNTDETAKPQPDDFYGATKASTEMFLSAYSKYFKHIHFNTIRPGYTFGNPAVAGGAMENDKRFFDICRNAASGKTIELIKHDGTQFIWAGHLAEIYVEVLAGRATNQVYYGLAKNFETWENVAKWAVDFSRPLRKGKPDAKIVLKDLGWSNKPRLYKVDKIKKEFGLSFDSTKLLKEHVSFLVNNPGEMPE